MNPPGFHFAHRIAFQPEEAGAILRSVPARAGVFALRGERETDQPYLMRAADLRRRLRRLLLPPETVDADGRPILSKRLNLRDRVRSIEWSETGSEFEGVLLLYRATHALFGEDEARKRLRLHCPYFLRVTMAHEHPRVFVSNKLSRRALQESFGPFASRAAAERVAEALGEQFKGRRCYEDLAVHPEHPGCVYGEMGRCLAPCKAHVTGATYRAEAERVFAYLRTRGESLLTEIAGKREAASEAMNFEEAAALHRQWEKVKAVAQGADPLVQPAGEVRALVLQPAAPASGDGPDTDSDTAHPNTSTTGPEAALFLLDNGRLVGPVRLSTLGVRAVREQTAVGSSLFAQPLMLAPLPETGTGNEHAAAPVATPETRAADAIAALTAEAARDGEPEPSIRGDALALFKRWYYRPEKQRHGEVLLPNPDGSWPLRKLLNAAARVVLGPPAALPLVNREAAADPAQQQAAQDEAALPGEGKTRVLHPGREGVERVVPVLPRRKRRGKALLPGEAVV